ncbi:hypothetical protein [Microbacterium candidum]|uniref:Uncharacterized protein n=1 Tax=Microbacterium candidum TaxID=3041922 RepID=A0ABT7MW06_9MICO|nr:hypothetical protein [Microbacterium sp. ASV49]MDL9978640.1 hypothetical protein [Microbacterium sp. ASV49]
MITSTASAPFHGGGGMLARPVMACLLWLSLIEREPAHDLPRRSTLLGEFVWISACAVGGMLTGYGGCIAAASAPAFVEGRVGGFAHASAMHVADVAGNDWFADTGQVRTRFAFVTNTNSLAAGTFVVRAVGPHARLDAVAIACQTAGYRKVPVRSQTIAYLQGVTWPCHALLVELTRTDPHETTVAEIELRADAQEELNDTQTPRRRSKPVRGNSNVA